MDKFITDFLDGKFHLLLFEFLEVHNPPEEVCRKLFDEQKSVSTKNLFFFLFKCEEFISKFIKRNKQQDK